MKYLTLIPDYTQSCIQDDLGRKIELYELELPADFIKEVLSWHASYRIIIPLDDRQRNFMNDEIEKLDRTGLMLARRLQDLISGGAKVKYYSEGKLRYLS